MLHTFLLIAWFALPALVSAILISVWRRPNRVFVGALCFACMIAGTFVLANYVWALDAHLLAEIDKYEPGSPEAERASDEWASDTDRSFTLLLSPLLTAVWYSGVFLLFFGGKWMARQLFPAKFASANRESHPRTASQRRDDGNPYQPPVAE